ncbi:hypothetical protein ACTID9_00815 [Brevibacillus fluminis]|uniref:hypothetical protein n=1 Tax=Brevibacillus fluminis TaxID=511487 RepID=UPI003F8C95F7
MTAYERNLQVLEALERTYAYDAAMTELLLPEIAKRYTTPAQQNENYRARLLHFRADIEQKGAMG